MKSFQKIFGKWLYVELQTFSYIINDNFNYQFPNFHPSYILFGSNFYQPKTNTDFIRNNSLQSNYDPNHLDNKSIRPYKTDTFEILSVLHSRQIR